MPGRLRRNLIIGIILGVAIYIVMGFYADLDSLREVFGSFRWAVLPVALGLVLFNYLIRFLKWEYLIRAVGVSIPVRPSFIIFFSGLTMSISPAKLGEVMKSFLLRDYAGVKVSRTAPVIVAERLTDVIGIVILGSFGALAYGWGRDILAVTIALVVVFVAVVQWRRLCLRLLAAAEHVPFLSRVAHHLEEFYESSYILLRLGRLLPAVTLSTAGWFTECVASWLLLRALGLEVDLLLVTFVFVTATLAGALAMIPGGLGVAEGSMTGLFINGGLDRTDAVAATLLIRLVTFWFAIAMGVAGLAAYGILFGNRGGGGNSVPDVVD
ncbi:MAG: UPF0104 family protein [Gaiellales bacterium]|nr:MAG: UPF0104 family protein [Gaiellales bacterium]